MKNSQNSKATFKIDCLFDKDERREAYLVTQKVSDGILALTDRCTLGGRGIKNFDMIEASDSEGRPRFDVFSFQFKHQSDIYNFSRGQIVTLDSGLE